MKKVLLIIFILKIIAIEHSIAQTNFEHTTNASNITANYTILDHPQLNSCRNCIVLVQPNGDAATRNYNAIGVWHTGSNWSIFNQSRNPMPQGVSYSISFYSAESRTVFVHKATPENISGNKTMISNGALNASPNATVYITQNWSPPGVGNVYNNSNVKAEYIASTGQWNIININESQIQPNTAFNVFVFPEGENRLGTTIIQNADVAVATPTVRTAEGLSTRNAPTAGSVVILANNNALNFEGNYQSFWTCNGNAFCNQPVIGTSLPSERILLTMPINKGGLGGDYWKNLPFQIGVKGSQWIGTAENNNGEAAIGTMTSSAFQTADRYLTFLAGGGNDISKLYVELQIKRTDYDQAWGTARRSLYGDTEDGYVRVARISPSINSDELFRYWFDLDEILNHNFSNKTIRIHLVDNKTTGWGHLNLDDFNFKGSIEEFIRFNKEGFSMAADYDKPIFGIADTHTHPANDLGFGGNTIVGKAGGNMATEFSDATCHASHSIGGIGASNTFLVGQGDQHHMIGYPTFAGFPTFDSKFHQQQHVDWLKRAHQGGINLICALGVTNMFWAKMGSKPDAPIDDESAVLQQIAEIKRMVQNNSSWMGIAETPKKARELILQGKLAVVLGVEMDNFGNFKDQTYIWDDANIRPPSKPLQLLPPYMPQATEAMQNKITEYYNLGIRQVTPLHYINGVFGGTAQFKYEFSLINSAFTNHSYNLTNGVNDDIYYNVQTDARWFDSRLKALFGNKAKENPMNCVGCNFDAVISTMNPDGLTEKGRMMITELMKKGMLVDMEHSSKSSAEGIFNIADRFNYPIMSSHSDPRDLSFKPASPLRFEGSFEEKEQLFKTSIHGNLSHEGQLSKQFFNKLTNSGGTVGVLTFPYRKNRYENPDNRVINDCDGSSKTWAQMYLYSVENMRGKGVALATDRGFNDFIAPRFGVNAAYKLKEEKTVNLTTNFRTNQRTAQGNAVRYDAPLRFFHPLQYQDGDINEIEEDAWKAIAYFHSIGQNPLAPEYQNLPADRKIPASAYGTHASRIENMVKGFFMTYEQAKPGYGEAGTGPQERIAAFCVKNQINPRALPDPNWERDAWFIENYDYLKRVWTLWTRVATSTSNEPLTRCKAGTREWDFNIDGMAHYGLLPDFLQDVKNVGVTPKQLTPLFNSAEDYIKMWEKADLNKQNVR